MSGIHKYSWFWSDGFNHRFSILSLRCQIGLFAALLLDIAGLKNIEILEYQKRVGGRVRTEYFSNDVTKDKLYGEFGAMRLPKGTGRVFNWLKKL
jgi:hypothetical protein